MMWGKTMFFSHVVVACFLGESCRGLLTELWLSNRHETDQNYSLNTAAASHLRAKERRKGGNPKVCYDFTSYRQRNIFLHNPFYQNEAVELKINALLCVSVCTLETFTQAFSLSARLYSMLTVHTTTQDGSYMDGSVRSNCRSN